MLLGDLVLALPGPAVDHRDAIGLAPRLDAAGEPARHPHQVRIVQVVVRTVVPAPPPRPEPTRVMAQREEGVQHDPVHAVIAAGQQVPVPLAPAAPAHPPAPVKMVMPQIPAPRHFSRLRDVAGRSDAELDALVEQAIADAYDEYEQLASFHVVIEEHLAVPFRTTVLGVEVTVNKIDLLSGSGIVAICSRGKHRQAIGILDLPLPAPPPAGAEWIDAYRHWAT